MLMRATLSGLVLAFALFAGLPARAESVVVGLSDVRVEIESNFVGTALTLFGHIERDAMTVGRSHGYDVVVVVRGPDEEVVTRRRDRVVGVWVNTESVTFPRTPSYLAVLSTRPVADIASSTVRRRYQVGLDATRLDAEPGASEEDEEIFREALVRRKQAQGLFIDSPDAVAMRTDYLFQTRIPLPANIRVGGYVATVHVFADGALVAREDQGFWVAKSGFEEQVSRLATRHPIFYGFSAVGIALFAGWFAGVIFRRD